MSAYATLPCPDCTERVVNLLDADIVACGACGTVVTFPRCTRCGDPTHDWRSPDCPADPEGDSERAHFASLDHDVRFGAPPWEA